MHCLYILEINPLSGASFADILSHSDNCIFILFIGVQKFLSLIRSYLFIFIFIALGGGYFKIYVKECFALTVYFIQPYI